MGASSRIPDLASRLDDVFADLGRPSDEATQARVPRPSRLQPCERDLDDWFAELAGDEFGS